MVSAPPIGTIDLLLAVDHMSLHPVDTERIGNLRLQSSPFGPELILIGSHPSLQICKVTINTAASSILHSSHASVKKFITQTSYEFFDCESSGIEPPIYYGNCQDCKECSFRSQMLSQREQYENHVSESKIQFDPIQKFVVSYPFTKDPCTLPNNKTKVLLKIAERDAFNKKCDKMPNNGALIELSDTKMKMWDWQIHMSLRHVVNESSTTTLLRIVANSTLSDRRGPLLNSILMKVHDTLSDQWDVINRWRTYKTTLC